MVSPFTKALMLATAKGTLSNGVYRINRHFVSRTETGDVPAYEPSLTYVPGRLHPVQADTVPSLFKDEKRVIHEFAIPEDYRYQTVVGGTRYEVVKNDRIVFGSKNYDVIGVKQSPGGSPSLRILFVAENGGN